MARPAPPKLNYPIEKLVGKSPHTDINQKQTQLKTSTLLLGAATSKNTSENLGTARCIDGEADTLCSFWYVGMWVGRSICIFALSQCMWYGQNLHQFRFDHMLVLICFWIFVVT